MGYWNKRTKITKLLTTFIAVLAIVLIAGCSSKSGPTGGVTTEIPRETITVYKSELCGCCDLYTKYLKKSDFDVEVVQQDDLTPLKDELNIPDKLRSCHTTKVGDYFVEGHMPKEAIAKLLAEKPDIAGIALPGMPSGSPGMPGGKQGEFVIYAVGKDGSTSEFMRI